MQKNCLGYPVEIVTDLFNEADKTLAKLLTSVTGTEHPRVLIVADLNVVQRFASLGTAIGKYMQHHSITLAGRPVVFWGGEKIKCDLTHGVALVLKAATNLMDNDCLLVLGGGTIIDVASFVVGQFCKGVNLVRIPTTPTAMIDAAFAEVASINVGDFKNALSIPSRPSGVIVDTTFAPTVMDGVWRASIAKALHVALLNDAELFTQICEKAKDLGNRDLAAMYAVIQGSIALRKSQDVYTPLSFFALALESISSYKLPNGYAETIGCLLDCAYARAIEAITAETFESVKTALKVSGCYECVNLNRSYLLREDDLLTALDYYLNKGNELVLPKGIGEHCEVKNLDREAMKAAFNLVK